MAVPDAGCGGIGGGSHGSRRHWLWRGWQSQMLVVKGRGSCSHGSHRHWLGGRLGVLMAVSDGGCGGERLGFSWQS